MTSPRLRLALGSASLLIGSVTVALVVGEILVRMALPALVPVGGGPALYRYSPVLGWEKRPNVEVSMRSSEWETTIRTNAFGMRGQAVPREKAPGVTRVLLLGDSFIEAYSVQEAATVSSRLQRALREAGLAGAEVLNGGTAGYGTDQELLFFHEHGAAHQPDVTVLFYYLNDLWDNARPTYWRGAKPYYALTADGLILRGVPVPRTQWASRELSDWLTTRSALYRLVRETIVGLRRGSGDGFTDETSALSVPGEFLGWRRPGGHQADEAWRLTEALLLELREAVERTGSEFLLFYVPSKPAVYGDVWSETRDAYGMSEVDWAPTADADRLRDICARAGLECLIPVERFQREAAPLSDEDALYFPIDGHWTAAGHALAARIIVEYLAGPAG